MREARRSSSAAFLASCNFSRQLSSRLLSQRSYGPQSYSDKLELNEFQGEQVAREHLCRLLPDITFRTDTASQHYLQVPLDSGLLSSQVC